MNKRVAFFVTIAVLLLSLAHLVVRASLRSDGQAKGATMKTQSKEVPIACKLGALDPAERARHQALAKQLRESVQDIRELSDGYALRLPADARAIMATAEWVTRERLCCPFFVFEMEVGGEAGEFWLRLTGREGVKQFIEAEMDLRR